MRPENTVLPPSVGDVPNTRAPEPVSSVQAVAILADENVANAVATLLPNPLTPVEIGRPVQVLSVPEVGVPRMGVVSVGEVAKTKRPEPVSSEITPASSEDDVAANAESLFEVVANVPLVGRVTLVVPVTVKVVPNAPLIVMVEDALLATPVPPRAGASVPVQPAVIVVARSNEMVGEPVSVKVTFVSSAFDSASPAIAAARLVVDGAPRNDAMLVPSPLTPVEIGKPVPLARVIVGAVPNTNAPEPVSSEITPASCADVVAANTERLFPV